MTSSQLPWKRSSLFSLPRHLPTHLSQSFSPALIQAKIREGQVTPLQGRGWEWGWDTCGKEIIPQLCLGSPRAREKISATQM